MSCGVRVELDVRIGRAVLLRAGPLLFDRRVRGRVLGLDLLQVVVDVSGQIASVHAVRQVARLHGNARRRRRGIADAAERTARTDDKQQESRDQDPGHATYSTGRASDHVRVKRRSSGVEAAAVAACPGSTPSHARLARAQGRAGQQRRDLFGSRPAHGRRRGIGHSEKNSTANAPVHFIQICILPDTGASTPATSSSISTRSWTRAA